MNERFWIRKIQQKHDEKSADKLTRKYYKEIYIFVYKQTLDEQLALDLTQEIFIRMLRSIASYEEKNLLFVPGCTGLQRIIVSIISVQNSTK